jgi:hypothetical protein
MGVNAHFRLEAIDIAEKLAAGEAISGHDERIRWPVNASKRIVLAFYDLPAEHWKRRYRRDISKNNCLVAVLTPIVQDPLVGSKSGTVPPPIAFIKKTPRGIALRSFSAGGVTARKGPTRLRSRIEPAAGVPEKSRSDVRNPGTCVPG